MRPEQFLDRYNVHCFYHFTDVRNLSSILSSGGILPYAESMRRGIDVPAPGGHTGAMMLTFASALTSTCIYLLTQHPMVLCQRRESYRHDHDLPYRSCRAAVTTWFTYRRRLGQAGDAFQP